MSTSAVDEALERARKLPDDLQREVADFVEFLCQRQPRALRTKLRFTWYGALSEWRDKYTSVELQHKASEWRIGKASARH